MSWPKPSRNNFELMSRTEPTRMISWLTSGELSPGSLTHAADIAGNIIKGPEIVFVLLNLLKHESPIVREGAVIGLSTHLDNAVRTALKDHLSNETSHGVRTTIDEVLLDD